MKYSILIVAVFCVMINHCFAQTARVSNLHFTLRDTKNNPIAATATFSNLQTGEHKAFATTATGEGTVELLSNTPYCLWLSIADGKYEFSLPATPCPISQMFMFDDAKASEQHATPFEALITLKVVSAQHGAMATTLTIVATDNSFSKKIETDKSGNATVLLPVNKKYRINCNDDTDLSSLDIPNQPFYYLTKTMQYEPSLKQPCDTLALIQIQFCDFNNVNIAGEELLVSNIDGQQYRATTNDKGIAQILVPIGNEYLISTRYNQNFVRKTIPSTRKKYAVNITYRDISSAEREKRRKEQIENALIIEEQWKNRQKELALQTQNEERIWDSIELENKRKDTEIQLLWEQERSKQKQFADSIAEIERLTDSAEHAQRLSEQDAVKHKQDSIQLLLLQQKLAEQKAKYRTDSILFEKQTQRIAEEQRQQEIKQKELFLENRARNEFDHSTWGLDLTVIHAMKKIKAKRKLIIVDITGSMKQHANILRNWFILNYNKTELITFVFYNDGDTKKTEEKLIGKTGGIYSCDSCNILNLENIMSQSYKGDGGDIPENTVEALIVATNNSKRKYDEVILVADNNSPVRDISLLEKLHTPIKVVVCGVTDIINEDYLAIANQTNGSIHTINLDIENLSNQVVDNKITIGNHEYIKQGRYFVRKE